MKKLSTLLNQRDALLRQARLANLAFAYQTLGDFAARVARAGLRGRVILKPVNPDEDRYSATLTPLEGNVSVIEEHFTEEDLTLLADVIGYATGHPEHELTFPIDQLAEFLGALRADLEQAGVLLDHDDAPMENADPLP